MEKSLNEQIAEFQRKKGLEDLRRIASRELDSYLAKTRRYIEGQIALGKMAQTDLAEHEQAEQETRESLAGKDDAWITKHARDDGTTLFSIL